MPDKTKVTKRGGEKVYTLRHQIPIWENRKPEFLEPGPASVFLVADNGDINLIDGTTEILAQFEPEQLYALTLIDSVFKETNNANV